MSKGLVGMKGRLVNINAKIEKWIPGCMLLISLSGFCFFYLIPFFVSFGYSIIDNPIRRQFCGLDNYKELFNNPYFLQGLKNTLCFMGVSIPLNMALSLLVAMVVKEMGKYSNLFSLFFLIPLAVPSATSAFFWENFFAVNGTLNKLLHCFGLGAVDWLNGEYGIFVMTIIFIWKNIGYNMALFISGLSNIPEEYYECAAVEGASRWWQFKHITLVYLMPTSFLVLIMTFVNSFKVFKEIYIMPGEYPPKSLYMLQHFMNNMFSSLNYSKLVSATYILTVVIVLVVVCPFKAEKKYSEHLHY